MGWRALAVLLTLLGVGPALADPAPILTLPTLALDPQPPPSIWTGLHVGTEVFGVSRLGGGHGSKGGFGGDVLVGYDREFANNIVLGVEGSAGYSPSLFGRARGYDFATAGLKVGYDMGRLMPFVTGDVVLLKPRLGPGLGWGGDDSLNRIFNGGGDLEASGRLCAGVEYAITNNLHVGVAVSYAQGRAALLP